MKIIYSILLICLIPFISCSEIDLNSSKTKGEKPVAVTEYSVESLHGGAKITFHVPASDEILYVKAEYQLDKGEVRETKSSLYKNYLIVDGFAHEGEYTIHLYSVAKGEVKSDPTTVKINVLEPPYLLARKDLNLMAIFGGINVSYQNECEANLAIQLIEKDSIGNWKDIYTHYTNIKKSSFSLRGYDTIPKEFGVCVKDRWGNISDTLIKTCKPKFEQSIPKKTWRKYILPGDITTPNPVMPDWILEKLWDGINAGENGYNSGVRPYWPYFTVDLGIKVSFSRINIRQRESIMYRAASPKIFEVYGSNDPNADGSWDDSWTKLGTFEVIKPSGSPVGKLTNEDRNAAMKGHDFEFDPTLPSFRYIRFKFIETWGTPQIICFTEFSLWGQIED